MNKTVFITGSSGFIGSNLAKRILTTEPDTKVIGLDNMNDYYDVRIKEERLAKLQKFENYTFIKGNLADRLSLIVFLSSTIRASWSTPQCAGWCSLFYHQSGCLHRKQYDWLL